MFADIRIVKVVLLMVFVLMVVVLMVVVLTVVERHRGVKQQRVCTQPAAVMAKSLRAYICGGRQVLAIRTVWVICHRPAVFICCTKITKNINKRNKNKIFVRFLKVN